MIRLFERRGSSEIQLIGKSEPREEWAEIRLSVCKLLRIRKADHAAKLLEEIPFDLYNGTNIFGDEFCLLYLNASLGQYVELAEQKEDPAARLAYQKIAETITEVGPHIRFVAVALDTKSFPEPVTSPLLSVTSDVVERALADCEQLIQSRGATSGVDRIHTAFHGYLLAVCQKYGFEAPKSAGVTQLFKTIREQHQSFADGGPRGGDIDRVVKSMATIIDSLNPLRNQATLVHPNDAVLEEAEAMLVINSVRSLLHYINKKLG